MLRIHRILLAIAFGCLSAIAAAGQTSEQTTTGRDRQSVNITVYNSNLGLVRETRRLTLPTGRIALRFADVTAQIRPETVHLGSLTAPSALRILEQNYQYDLLNPGKLLDKFVGKEITLVLRRNQNNTETFEPVQATLLSNNGGQVWRINGQIVINPRTLPKCDFLIFPRIWLRPRRWFGTLKNREAGVQTIEASYLTAGMNWRADYVLLVNADDTKGDLQGWVTLTNTSGTSFEDARLQLVAGDVNRVTPERTYAFAVQCSEKPLTKVRNFRSRDFLNITCIHCSGHQRAGQRDQTGIVVRGGGFDVKKEFVLSGQRYYYTNYNNLDSR